MPGVDSERVLRLVASGVRTLPELVAHRGVPPGVRTCVNQLLAAEYLQRVARRSGGWAYQVTQKGRSRLRERSPHGP